MNSYYTLVKFSANELSDDNLTVGIIFANSTNLRMELSNFRMKQFKKFASIDNNIIDFIIVQLKNFITEQNNKLMLNADNVSLFNNQNISAYSSFDYLHRYSNGLLRFSEPKLFGKEFDEDTVKKLYSVYLEDNCITKAIN
jgi:hypothetical protein